MRRAIPFIAAVMTISVPAALAAGPAPDEQHQPLLTAPLAADPLAQPHAERSLDRATARARVERREAKEAAGLRAPAVPIPPQLEAIAACESGGDPSAIGGGGLYRGKYQFSVETWQAVGGTGDPAAAPEVEQDRRAAMLYAQSGPGQWPVCGQ